MVTTLWKLDLTTIPQPLGSNTRIKGGPLFDLVKLQEMLKTGALNLGDSNQFWVATKSCEHDLEHKLRWSPGDQLTKFIQVLRPAAFPKGDFVNSQWCKDFDGQFNACDSYKVRIDEGTWKRDVNAPLYYLKFSIDQADVIYLALISCHLDKAF